MSGTNTIGKSKPSEPLAIASETVERAAAATTKRFEQASASVQEGISTAAAGLEKTQASMKQGMERAMKTAEELVAFSQGNVEACVKSGQIWAAGMQDLSKHVAASAQASLDETLSTFKAMTGVKSLKDAFDLQAGLARSSVEKAVAETGRITDASVRLAEQTFAPITARVTLAV